VLLFGFVVAFGAPYLPTLKKQTNEALDLLDLKPGQTLLELGCGDGRVMLAAAKRGLDVVGYELNPLLVIVAWIVTLRYRRQVSVRWGNFWRASWPQADGVFVFLLDRYMSKLDKKMVQVQSEQKRPIKLVSFTFKIPGKKPTKQHNGLLRYDYK
jgi:16S rRNA A1518/A1519 N6-dimethyltransferase RsmA/KsgA/DIM1 with predicted DNA glycosylase/AP lyase activity